jgi:hypothetical protein
MDKRYQVFISSTYADLKEERSKVIQTIMELDCMPAGMEIFPAIDEEQFNFIKRIIDDCDYYLLIIGGRYGSLSENGISYTEKEFDYAVEKGIRVIAFIHANPEEIIQAKSEKDQFAREKLEAFKKKVQTGRLIKYWTSADELPGLVALSLPKTIKTYPAIGWVRANNLNPDLLQQLNELQKVNADLKDQLNQLKLSSSSVAIENLADLDDTYTFNGTYQLKAPKNEDFYEEDNEPRLKWSVNTTWRQIFTLIAVKLINQPSDNNVRSILSTSLFAMSKKKGYYPTLDMDIYQTIKFQFEALGLIEVRPITKGSSTVFIWDLTQKGKKMMLDYSTVKKQ